MSIPEVDSRNRLIAFLKNFFAEKACCEDSIQKDGDEYVVKAKLIPDEDDAYDLGSSSRKWANIYTGDLHLVNDRGNWTVVEEEDCLTIRNNKIGKRFKLLMEEIED